MARTAKEAGAKAGAIIRREFIEGSDAGSNRKSPGSDVSDHLKIDIAGASTDPGQDGRGGREQPPKATPTKHLTLKEPLNNKAFLIRAPVAQADRAIAF